MDEQTQDADHHVLLLAAVAGIAALVRDGRERSAGRCPCCDARWLTGVPTGWACLGTGRLALT